MVGAGLEVLVHAQWWWRLSSPSLGLSSAASLAISAGATVKGVQGMLGHASATVTLHRNGHLLPPETLERHSDLRLWVPTLWVPLSGLT